MFILGDEMNPKRVYGSYYLSRKLSSSGQMTSILGFISSPKIGVGREPRGSFGSLRERWGVLWNLGLHTRLEPPSLKADGRGDGGRVQGLPGNSTCRV